MSMNPPKQRRNRKKKETPLSPEAAREEAELRMKIQQSLQTQYVDRATVEDTTQGGVGGNNHLHNPLMTYGQVGMCGMIGGDLGGMPMMNQDLMMQQEMMQREMMMQNQQGNFNSCQFGMTGLTPGEMAQCMKNAELMYEMQLQQKRMILQNMEQEMMQQQGWNLQMQHGINSADIMRELRIKQEQLLQIGAAQKHMKEKSGVMSSGSGNQFYEHGFTGNNTSYVDDESFGRQHSNESAHSQHSNVVDLTGESHPGQSPSPHALEMDAMLKHKMMQEMQRQQSASPHMNTQMKATMKQNMLHQMQGQQIANPEQSSAQAPSPQNVEEMQAEMQQHHVQSPPCNEGNNLPKDMSPGKSREMLFAMLERITPEPVTESELESLPMPTPGGGSVRDSLNVGDLRGWLAVKSNSGTETMGFHSVNGMSASFSSVIGDGDNIITPGETSEGGNALFRKVTNEGAESENARRTLSNRDSLFDLDPISEDGDEGGKKDRIPSTINDIKQESDQEQKSSQEPHSKPRKGPSLGETNRKESLTLGDIKNHDITKNIGSPSHSSGMSLSLGDFGYDILDSHMSGGSLTLRNSLMTQGETPNSIRQNSNHSEMMMSMDSLTYSALLKGNESNNDLTLDLSDVLEGDNESRASSSTDLCKDPDGKPGPLGVSQDSKASSSRSLRSQRKSTSSRPSVMSEISQWSNSNPYGDDAHDNGEQDTDGKERQYSGESVDIAELEALNDFSLSMMSSIRMSEMNIDDDLRFSMQALEVSPSKQGSDEHNN